MNEVVVKETMSKKALEKITLIASTTVGREKLKNNLIGYSDNQIMELKIESKNDNLIVKISPTGAMQAGPRKEIKPTKNPSKFVYVNSVSGMGEQRREHQACIDITKISYVSGKVVEMDNRNFIQLKSFEDAKDVIDAMEEYSSEKK